MEGKNELSLRFRVPRGKVSQIMGMMNFLQSKFQSLDVELTARGRALRVRGRRRDCCLEPECRLVHMEIAYSRFERQVELPGDLDYARITSEFRLGMLLVRVQREGYA